MHLGRRPSDYACQFFCRGHIHIRVLWVSEAEHVCAQLPQSAFRETYHNKCACSNWRIPLSFFSWLLCTLGVAGILLKWRKVLFLVGIAHAK
jgi:hypothetical protein